MVADVSEEFMSYSGLIKQMVISKKVFQTESSAKHFRKSTLSLVSLLGIALLFSVPLYGDSPEVEVAIPDAEALIPKKEKEKEAEPYDPIKENGTYFDGWETPDVAIVLTGLLDGYIEPCGCAGMDRMKGGLSRRADFLKSLRDQKWPIAAIDAGLITSGYGFQEELKFDMAINAFYLMGYSAIGISQNELRFPAHYLLKYTVPPKPEEQSLFVSANIGIYAFVDLYTLPCKIIEQNGIRIGVTSVVDQGNLPALDEKIQTKPAEDRLGDALTKMKEEDCAHLILIAHGSEQFVEKLAKAYPDFDIILTGDSPTTPPLEPKRTEAGQLIIEVGEKGKYAVVLGIYGDTVRYQRVALDSRYKQSGDVHLLMTEYQDVLRGIVEADGFDGLHISPLGSPKKSVQGEYVGSAKCGTCHEDIYEQWRDTRHSTAWKSISLDPPNEHSANPPRDCDPDCVSCHVVGWNGIAHIPYKGGYADPKTTPHLLNVGCESCHGPGGNHITAEIGNNNTLKEQIRSSMKLGDTVKQVCYSCHDADNSPNFDFDKYYEKIDHSTQDDE